MGFLDWLSARKSVQDLQPTRWAVVDCETTGLDTLGDRLLSIGGVAMVDGEVIAADSFEIVIRQDSVSSHDNITIHGITGEAQRGGVPAREALEAFEQWRADAPLVGWHVPFDYAFIARTMTEQRMTPPNKETLDLAPLAVAITGQKLEGLDDWLAWAKIPLTARHSAAGDAWMTALLMTKLHALAKKQGVERFHALRSLAKSARWV